MSIDLHTHTIYSDGGLTPNSLVVKAKEAGVRTLAITDHDNVAAIDVATIKGKELGVEIIPAVEITAYFDKEHDFHILGYFIDYKKRDFVKKLKEFAEQREAKARKVVEKLNNLDYKVRFDEIRALAKGTFALPHFAYAVINKKDNEEKLTKVFGEVPDTGTFIRKYLVAGGEAFVAREAATPQEAIDLIHAASGIAVLAHPCWSLTEKKGKKLIFEKNWIKKLTKAGLDGIEVYAHRENEEDTKKCVAHFEKVADELNLIKTGGSDFHGFGSAGKELGFKGFYLKVPEQVLKELKSKIRN